MPTIEPGWYLDPVDASRFRQWTGARWTHVVYDGTLSQDRAIVENLPFPRGLRAPEVAPRRRPLLPWLLACGAAVALLVVLVNTRTTSSSSGGVTFGDVGAAEVDSATTVPPYEARCVGEAFARDDALVAQALTESNATGGLDVNHAWSRLASLLAQIDLTLCSVEFTAAFDLYVTQVASYGSYVEDRTGSAAIDDMFNGDDAEQRRAEMLATINSAYDELRHIGSDLGLDATRGPIYLRD